MPKIISIKEYRFVEPEKVLNTDEVMPDEYSPVLGTSLYRQMAERLEASPDYTCRRSQERSILVKRLIWSEATSSLPYDDFKKRREAMSVPYLEEYDRRDLFGSDEHFVDLKFDFDDIPDIDLKKESKE